MTDGPTDITAASVDELVRRYADAASAHHDATEQGDHERANAQHDIVASAYRELRRRDRASVLLVLLDQPDVGVRSWAAAHALEFAPAEGERVLTELSTEPGIAGFNAQMTLETWREGSLRFP